MENLIPYPYLLDLSTDIFGWEYLLMPRMKGRNLSDSFKESYLTDADRLEIANSQGEILKEAQKLTNNVCGRYNLQTNSIKAYDLDWETDFVNQTIQRLEDSSKYNPNTSIKDIEWTSEILVQARKSIEMFTPTFYMRDFKSGNMVVDNVDGIWKVTGLFDLMECSFGHPESDISRLFTTYIENKHEDLAYTFINSYIPENFNIDMFIKRFPLFMLHDRTIAWEWAQRMDRVWWDKSLSFKQWISPFLNIDKNKIHSRVKVTKN